MKPREPRHKVLIDARLRQGSGWSDARILDISSLGLMARAAEAPPRGSYVEISRGAYRLVARVVWVDGDRFGARAQDVIALEAITRGTGSPLPRPANLNNDRRRLAREARTGEQLASSRFWSRRAEFVAVSLFGCAAAALVFDAVSDTLSKPLGLIEARLGATR